MQNSRYRTRKMVITAMLCAMAYVVMLVGRFPVVLFLKYDPKDVIITLGGLLFGPMNALIVSVIVSLIEMFTASDTGIIGLVMNILSSASFACIAASIYKKKRTLKGAILALILGVLSMCVVMLAWNFLISPLYMGITRQEIAPLLFTAFLPFNLIKGTLNAALTMLLYKPVVRALQKADLIEAHAPSNGSANRLAVVIVCVFVLLSCVLCILALQGIL